MLVRCTDVKQYDKDGKNELTVEINTAMACAAPHR